MIAESKSPDRISIQLSTAEIETLSSVVHHYERVMGVARHLVAATAPPRIRRRYRYIVQESARLDDLAADWRQDAGDSRADMSLDTAVAFWGRLLSNIRTKRSRRKTTKEMLGRQEALAGRFGVEMQALWRVHPEAVETSIGSRRRREQAWMLEELKPQDSSPVG